jgi:hypothetical protein
MTARAPTDADVCAGLDEQQRARRSLASSAGLHRHERPLNNMSGQRMAAWAMRDKRSSGVYKLSAGFTRGWLVNPREVDERSEHAKTGLLTRGQG